MNQFDVQLYSENDEARAWINDCVIDIRSDGCGTLDKKKVAETLALFGCTVNKRWTRTDWGWQAKFTVGDSQEKQ